MRYPEVDIFLIDKLNPSVGYEVHVRNGTTGKQMLDTFTHPITGADLLSYAACLEVAAMYAGEVQR